MHGQQLVISIPGKSNEVFPSFAWKCTIYHFEGVVTTVNKKDELFFLKSTQELKFIELIKTNKIQWMFYSRSNNSFIRFEIFYLFWEEKNISYHNIKFSLIIKVSLLYDHEKIIETFLFLLSKLKKKSLVLLGKKYLGTEGVWFFSLW